jgi:predicted ArsR family transcriptional regulator
MAEAVAVKLTEKTAMALAYLQANEGEFFGDEIAGALELNPRGIHGVMNSLFKKGLVDKVERERVVLVEDKEGNSKEVTKTYKAYYLTSEGIDFEIPAE